MRVRQPRQTIGDFEHQEFKAETDIGIEVPNDFVLVLVDKAAEKSSGGILIPESTQTAYTLNSEQGLLVAAGPGAFSWSYDRTRPWEGWKFQPGDRVAFERHAGQNIFGKDGRSYRLMPDKAVGAKLTF